MAKHFTVTYQGGASYHVGKYTFHQGKPVALTEKEAEQFYGKQGFHVEEVRDTKKSAEAKAENPPEEMESAPEDADIAPQTEDAEPLPPEALAAEEKPAKEKPAKPKGKPGPKPKAKSVPAS